MKLESLINKQRVTRHQQQDLWHRQNRQKNRSNRLCERFTVPQSSSNCLYISSNIFGNQFTLEEGAFQKFDCSEQVQGKILDIFSKINREIFQLWKSHRQQASQTFFESHRRFILTITVILIICVPFLEVIGLFGSIFGSSVESFTSLIGEHKFQILMYLLLVGCVSAFISFGIVWKTKYKKHSYDKEAVNLVAKILENSEKKFSQLGVSIKGDRLLTWIRFSIKSEPSQDSQQKSQVQISLSQNDKSQNDQ